MLLLLLGACSSVRDGTWLGTFVFVEDTCDPDAAAGGRADLLLTLSHTSADSLVIDGTGLILVGKENHDTFEVAYQEGYQLSNEGCAEHDHLYSMVLAGSFTPDLGMSATLEISTTDSLEDCFGTTDASTCTSVYDVSGLYLNAEPEKRPLGQVAWGYLPGSGYL